MLLYVRKSFMIFKMVLACIAFLAAIIALLGTSQNSLLLTQEGGKVEGRHGGTLNSLAGPDFRYHYHRRGVHGAARGDHFR